MGTRTDTKSTDKTRRCFCAIESQPATESPRR
jgi:hypothetical protein